MLFKRLYNWIKYKTLPSSFLFKNRLFVERDSKHRRIFSNFGLSFRNSKWSNYENYNIKSQFKNNYFRFIFYIFFLIIIVILCGYFNKYYIFFYFFNNFSFFFWISLDTFDYYLSFLIWLCTIFLSLFFNFLYSYFFFNNFSNNFENKNLFGNYLFSNLHRNHNLNKNDGKVSKNDLNWIFYSWLTNKTSLTDTKILEKIFETNVNTIWWNNYYNFFINLYKSSFNLSLLSEKNNFFSIKNNLNVFNNNNFKGNYPLIINFFNNNNSIKNNSNLLFYYFINNYETYFENKNLIPSSTKFVTNRFEWNLYNFINEIDNYSFLIKNKNGFFYIHDFDYKKFSNYLFNFEELWSLNFFLKNQLNIAKWNRWLYRYSILHRKILKNSHKLTLTKKLINSGFYNSKLFNKNIWANEYFSKFSSSTQFSTLFDVYYNNLFINNKINYLNTSSYLLNNGKEKNSLFLLNFHENSYFWYIKRFYLFNTLSRNSINSKLNNNNIANKINNIDTVTKDFLFFMYLLNTSSMSLITFSHVSNFYNNVGNFFFNYSTENVNFYFIKDFYLLNNQTNLFSKDNLNILYWITSVSDFNNKISFFNYRDSMFNTHVNTKFYDNGATIYKNLTPWISYSLINFDNYYLNDLTYFNLFY